MVYTDVHSVTLAGVAFQPNMTSNPAIASRLQSNVLVGRVAELTSEVIRQGIFQDFFARLLTGDFPSSI